MKIDELRKLAQEATLGKWFVVWDSRPDVFTDKRDTGYMGEGHLITFAKYDNYADAVFVAAANPETILSLLEYVAALEAAGDELCDYVESDCSNQPDAEEWRKLRESGRR